MVVVVVVCLFVLSLYLVMPSHGLPLRHTYQLSLCSCQGSGQPQCPHLQSLLFPPDPTWIPNLSSVFCSRLERGHHGITKCGLWERGKENGRCQELGRLRLTFDLSLEVLLADQWLTLASV